MSGELKTLATALFKIANDIRWMSSGPRCGLGELALPKRSRKFNYARKVNPGMAEALMQVCCQSLVTIQQ